METKKKHMKTITNIISPALTAIVLACFALSPVAQARPQPTPIDHKIALLRNEIIALDASLITYMSQAETSIGNDVELLHASIVAAQLETVDTKAAYREAKSLVRDLDTLRRHAIADLTLPSYYTPPDVPSTALGDASTDPESVLASATALAGASMDPETVLASTYEDFGINLRDLFVIIGTATLDARKKLEKLAAQGDAINIVDMFEMQMLMNHLSQVSDMASNVVSAANSAINSMARNVKE
jgi:hypothetical protein